MNVAKSASLVSRTLSTGARQGHSRCIHQSSVRRAVTSMQMPAMSPTMTEGGIAQWKKREGESFTAGDVLLEIETDKATIDVEAQDDGIMGKILLPDGSKNVPVGKVIALLAEEGDDISNLEAPQEEETASKPSKSASPPPSEQKSESSSSPAMSSSKASSQPNSSTSHGRDIKLPHPLFPSVQRLLVAHASSIQDVTKIKGTGLRGMITKGDVLAFLGLASHPLGTAKDVLKKQEGAVEKKTVEKKEEQKPLDGPALRRLIVSTMLQSSIRARNTPPSSEPAPDFNSIIADYLPPAPSSRPPPPAPSQPLKPKRADFLDGLY